MSANIHSSASTGWIWSALQVTSLDSTYLNHQIHLTLFGNLILIGDGREAVRTTKMPIKRYKLWMHCKEDCEMDEDTEGEWVRWDDPLVQAAPELLKVMKGLELYARDLLLLIDGGKAEMSFNLHKEITKAQAAIAKARGE